MGCLFLMWTFARWSHGRYSDVHLRPHNSFDLKGIVMAGLDNGNTKSFKLSTVYDFIEGALSP